MRIEIRLNGEPREIPAPLNIVELLDHFDLPKDRVAVERNRSIVPKQQWEAIAVAQGDELEVVHFVGGGSGNDDAFVIAGRTFKSRLIVGTGKYPSNQVMAEAHRRSGTDMVTVAVRRIDLKAPKGQSLLDFIDREKTMILPNTAACYNVDDAVRTARLGREAGLSNWVKLEVIGDEKTLFPDTFALVEATRILVKEGFVVLPYTNDDLIVARKLIDAGAAAIMAGLAQLPQPPGFDTPRLVPTTAVLAISSLAVAGILAGLYPASKAAALQPVEALRKE